MTGFKLSTDVPAITAWESTDLMLVGKPASKRMTLEDLFTEVIVSPVIKNSNGIDIDTTDGGDADVDLITCLVTGTPKLWWDESDDGFRFSKPFAALAAKNAVAAAPLAELTAVSTDTANNDFATLVLINSNSTNNNYAILAWGDDNSHYTSQIKGIITDHTNNYGELDIVTRGAGHTGSSIRIKADGKIGLGQTAPLAHLHVGAGNVNSSDDCVILVSRNVNSDIAGNGHCFSDSCAVTRPDIGYNSFDAFPTYSGTNNFNHYAAFQARPIYGSSGTIADVYGYISQLTINAGTVTNGYGVYVYTPTGAGTLTNHYGVYVEALTKGGTKNFAVYTAGATQSHFEGAFEFINVAAPAVVADGAKLYASDQAAGNSCLHTKTENGAILKLYQETTGVAEAAFVQGSGDAVNDNSTFGGYTLQQIVKALQLQGLLA